jgi:hypothetical protein
VRDGSAESDAHDQVLDTVLVGPVAVGSYKFVFQADPPDISRIPQSDILGVTVLLLTGTLLPPVIPCTRVRSVQPLRTAWTPGARRELNVGVAVVPLRSLLQGSWPPS